MSISTTLREELDLVIQNLLDREWVQGSYEMESGAVCAHGAVQTCKGLQPGDEEIIRQVMRAYGLTEAWNDTEGRSKAEVEAKFRTIAVTDENLEFTFGPHWRKVVWLARTAAAYSGPWVNPTPESVQAAGAVADILIDREEVQAEDAAFAWRSGAAVLANRMSCLLTEGVALTVALGLQATDHGKLLIDEWTAHFGEIGEAE